jgi:hypothetical protein
MMETDELDKILEAALTEMDVSITPPPISASASGGTATAAAKTAATGSEDSIYIAPIEPMVKKNLQKAPIDKKHYKIKDMKKLCFECEAMPEKMLMCSKCRLVGYCSKDCQVCHDLIAIPVIVCCRYCMPNSFIFCLSIKLLAQKLAEGAPIHLPDTTHRPRGCVSS